MSGWLLELLAELTANNDISTKIERLVLVEFLQRAAASGGSWLQGFKKA